jgi:hypothetical protein
MYAGIRNAITRDLVIGELVLARIVGALCQQFVDSSSSQHYEQIVHDVAPTENNYLGIGHDNRSRV